MYSSRSTLSEPIVLATLKRILSLSWFFIGITTGLLAPDLVIPW